MLPALAPPCPRDEVLDGFQLAHAMLAGRAGHELPSRVLGPALEEALRSQEAGGARRAAARLTRPLVPAATRHLDPRAKALLGAEVGGATGRRWMREAPTRPGYTPHPGVRACVRALALAQERVARGE
ncbi:MAG: hypothetical protein KC593_07425 [Myxococcales bacterium]|nr:hypothetical protein [Myxococcales bacterium]MCB9628874.1 hypothetical protein [Sandaracinaceae bacterium]